MNKHELEKEIEWLQLVIREERALVTLLWEYVSEKDVDEINKRLEEYYENTME